METVNQIEYNGALYNIQDAEAQKSLVYSQNEIDTGKIWIDGKKIYRKVVDCGYLLNKNVKKVEHNIKNIDTITKIDGVGYTDSEDYLPIPYVYAVTPGQGPITLFAKKTNITIRTYGDRTGVKVLVTLEYTKTN